MKEMMSTAAAQEIEPREKLELLLEMKRRNLERLKEVTDMQALWVSNIRDLDARVPHDPVLMDDKTYSFDVLMNAWSAELAEVEATLTRLNKLQQTLDEEIKALQEDHELEAIDPKELN